MLGFIRIFLGTFVLLGNLIDVWPLKLYLWSFGAMVMNFEVGFRDSLVVDNVNH